MEPRILINESPTGETEKTAAVVCISSAIRVRPPLASEADCSIVLNCRDERQLEISLSGSMRLETVDVLFGDKSTQREVYSFVQPYLCKAAEGYNVTVLTYGQTGSGKTHTMFGSDWTNIVKSRQLKEQNKSSKQEQMTFVSGLEDQNHSGVIPRTIRFVFERIATARPKHTKVYCSFLQLYNQNFLDLLEEDEQLARNKKMVIHENKEDGIYVEGLCEVEVHCLEDCVQWMQRGEKNRVVRQTRMNIKSSRSHTLFQLLVEETFPAQKSFRRMKINLCDLAGSEKLVKSERIDQSHLGELKSINLSLTCLGKAISALSGSTGMRPVYRDSKLTRLLQDSLGGNTFTVILATVSPTAECLEESLNTLKFLERAKQVKTSVVAHRFSNNNDMLALEKEIVYLKDVLKLKRNGVNVPSEINAKLRHLQLENEKLKELIDEDIVHKLKMQNYNLKKQLGLQRGTAITAIDGSQKGTNKAEKFQFDFDEERRGNGSGEDVFSDYRTIEYHLKAGHELNEAKSSFEIVRSCESSSKGTAKTFGRKKMIKDGKGDEGLSTKKSSFKSPSMDTHFPKINYKMSADNTKAGKILERILELEKLTQDSKLKLQQDLQHIGQPRHPHSRFMLKMLPRRPSEK